MASSNYNTDGTQGKDNSEGGGGNARKASGSIIGRGGGVVAVEQPTDQSNRCVMKIVNREGGWDSRNEDTFGGQQEEWTADGHFDDGWYRNVFPSGETWAWGRQSRRYSEGWRNMGGQGGSRGGAPGSAKNSQENARKRAQRERKRMKA